MSTIIRISTVVSLIVLSAFGLMAQTQKTEEVYCAYNGFEMVNLEIPLTEVFQGGPGKDGIPSLEIPRFANGEKVDFITDDEMVIGVTMNGVTKAYPVRIMNYHEVINDMFGDEQVAVTFSPLTASAAAFSSGVDGETRTFSVSGLLYNNNLLFYDWETKSLWSQMMGQAVSGSSSGKSLTQVPAQVCTWGAWRAKHPETRVLSPRTGYKRQYDMDPYAMFGPESRRLMFPINFRDKKLPLKEQVLGVNINGQTRAYPLALLASNGSEPVIDEVNGQTVFITYDNVAKTAWAANEAGDILPTFTTYWFAWSAFHPETDIYGVMPEKYNLAMQFLTGGR